MIMWWRWVMAYYYNEEFLDKYIGNGMSLLHTFDETKLGTRSVSGLEKIHNSIYSILSTRIGERFMMPEFGSKLHTLIFEPNDAIFADLADFYIRDALGKWEKRIEVTNVEVKIMEEGNVVPIAISYRITNSNIYDNYIYPYNKKSNDVDLDIYREGEIQESAVGGLYENYINIKENY